MPKTDKTAPTIAVTIGDPAGIGPEVVLKALSDPAIAALAQWVVIGDASALERVGKICGLPLAGLRDMSIRDLKALRNASRLKFGRLNAECGAAAAAYVRHATQMCLRGEADAIVTAPLNKAAVTLTGIRFTGHTEFIAELCGVEESRMLLANDRLRVVHVFTHVSLQQSCRLSSARIVVTIELGSQAMRLLGFERPRIAVCGLNPHAGEHGLFGQEDREFIAPAVETARNLGFHCEGPLPADTTFLRAVRGAYDLVVAMYHDQGHIPMKLLDFENTVNVTLGLPIVRTSVDHGTAFDIAGKNRADPSNMKAALKMAATMAARRASRPGSGT